MTARIIQANPTPFKTVDVDPVTLDIIENALRNARIEMDATLVRTAMSPGIREQGDAFPLIADHQGKMIVGQFGSYIGPFLDGYDGTVEDGDLTNTAVAEAADAEAVESSVAINVGGGGGGCGIANHPKNGRAFVSLGWVVLLVSAFFAGKRKILS